MAKSTEAKVRNLWLHFAEIIFGAVPATLTLPIALLGSIFSVGFFTLKTPTESNRYLLLFCLVALGGLLGIIGLWWAILETPFKNIPKSTHAVKISFLILGIVSATLLTIATKGYAAIIFLGPFIVALRQIIRQFSIIRASARTSQP